jgi:hypothetical protein
MTIDVAQARRSGATAVVVSVATATVVSTDARVRVAFTDF